MVLNVPCLNGPSNHVIRPFENGTKKCHKGQIFVFQMFGIQMVIVFFCRFPNPVAILPNLYLIWRIANLRSIGHHSTSRQSKNQIQLISHFLPVFQTNECHTTETCNVLLNKPQCKIFKHVSIASACASFEL